MYVKFLIFGKKKHTSKRRTGFDVKMGGRDFWKRSKFWKVQFRLKSAAGGIGTKCPYKWLIGATTKPPLRIDVPSCQNSLTKLDFLNSWIEVCTEMNGQWFSTLQMQNDGKLPQKPHKSSLNKKSWFLETILSFFEGKRPIFRGYVSFREGIPNLKKNSCTSSFGG